MLDFFEVAWHRTGDQVVKIPIAYQATVSTTHPMSSDHLKKLLDGFHCTAAAPLVVVFVLPTKTYSRSSILGRKKENEVHKDFKAQTSPGLAPSDLDRVVQFKCAVPERPAE